MKTKSITVACLALTVAATLSSCVYPEPGPARVGVVHENRPVYYDNGPDAVIVRDGRRYDDRYYNDHRRDTNVVVVDDRHRDYPRHDGPDVVVVNDRNQNRRESNRHPEAVVVKKTEPQTPKNNKAKNQKKRVEEQKDLKEDVKDKTEDVVDKNN